MQEFKSVQFMPARDKERVFKDWNRFLVPLALDEPGDEPDGRFTHLLYHHLPQHCSYIAHYNRHGFYVTYFADPEDAPKFLQQFDKDKGYVSYEYGGVWWLPGADGDYSDINGAMCEAFEPKKGEIYAALHRRAIRQRESQLERLQQELDNMKGYSR